MIKFDAEQLKEIYIGFDNGLTTEQVKKYANLEFSAEQMKWIRLGLEKKFPAERMALYTNPKFDLVQMNAIYNGIKDNLTEEQLRFYADTKFTGNQMTVIYDSMKKLSFELVQMFAKPDISVVMMEEIKNKLVADLYPDEQLFEVGIAHKRDIKEINERLGRFGDFIDEISGKRAEEHNTPDTADEIEDNEETRN